MLLVAVLLGVGLVVSAEDLPETPYDESETLPFECAPMSAFVRMPLSSSLTVMSCASVSEVVVASSKAAPGNDLPPSDAVASLTILDHVFRC